MTDLGITEGDITDAVIYPEDREPLLRTCSTQKKNLITEIISAAIERARDSDPFVAGPNLWLEYRWKICREEINPRFGPATLPAKHLFDSETDRIEVSNFIGQHRKVLFWDDVDQPRSLQLYPDMALMFWTNWGEVPKIEKASMDGNQNSRQILVSSDIYWPNGLAIDYEDKKLFWADAKLKTISCINFDGSSRKIMVTKDLPHTYALAIYRNSIYFSDWKLKSIRYCNKHNCAQKYNLTAGPGISPMTVKIFEKDMQPYKSTPCHKNNGGCTHLCLLSPTQPFYKCACPSGILLKDDGKTCEDRATQFLLIARRADVRMVSLETMDFTDSIIPVHGIKHIIAVDYDPSTDYFYWADDDNRGIRRAYLNGTNQESLITTKFLQSDGIAIDWVSQNLYWTDAVIDCIEVAKIRPDSNELYRKVIVETNLQEPRAIVVDPDGGYIYWSDWGNKPMIERAYLDGTHRSSLITTDVKWPNALALDFAQKKLYWADAGLDKIEVANYDGSERIVLIADDLPHIFAISILQDYLYWTDWQHRWVVRVHKVTGQNREIIVEQLSDLMGIKAASTSHPPASNPCGINNGGCQYLCFNRPDRYVCSCPSDLEVDPSNPRTCRQPQAFLLYPTTTHLQYLAKGDSREVPLPGISSIFDFDISEEKIFWVNSATNVIYSAYSNGSHIESVVNFGLKTPESIALDWVAKNLYWVDSGTKRIEVCRYNGTSRLVLIWKNVEMPRSLVLCPDCGLMFWIDLAIMPHIERANLAGQERTTIVKTSTKALALQIHIKEQRLYWSFEDGHAIETSNFEGRDKRTIPLGVASGKPQGLAIYQSSIYWSDLDSTNIYQTNLQSGQTSISYRNIKKQVGHIKFYHQSVQPGWNICSAKVKECSHLCFYSPEKKRSRLCACPNELILDQTCIVPRNYLLFAQRNLITRKLDLELPEVSLPIQGIKSIKAIDYNAVEKSVYWLESRTKVVKRSFENGTKGMSILSISNNISPYDFAVDPYARVMFWSCAFFNSINATRLDGSRVGTIILEGRPRLIALNPNTGKIYWTNMGKIRTIEEARYNGQAKRVLEIRVEEPVAITVDAESNTLYWADSEMNKIEAFSLSNHQSKLIKGEVSVSSPGLLLFKKSVIWVDKDSLRMERIDKTGDNYQSLAYTNDIVDFVAVTAPSSNHSCQGHSCSHLCAMGLDAKAQCLCPRELYLSETKTCILPPPCPPGHYRCYDYPTECVPDNWVCDAPLKCDGPFINEEGNFECQNKECIRGSLRCNGFVDCQDGSDEFCCNNFMCHNFDRCIDLALKCNSMYDCSDQSDESPQYCNQEAIKQIEGDKSSHSYLLVIIISLVTVSIVVVLFGAYLIRRTKTAEEDSRPPTAGSQPMRHTHNNKYIAGPSASIGYDRARITGASSSSSSSYPPNNPPPSPATLRQNYTQHFRRSPGSSSADEHLEIRLLTAVPSPPPPTPLGGSYLCTTPSTERSFFCPPPPTPVPESDE
ncbi:LRP6 [Cordylochernes scorpioides]|uniref:LRP6 n=1 Tax=Cordylochernes scorpioides TaxID=51811 RepID=A0ABY6KR71_9ARAC|nr:LRP6 [Cordylochernes scorpioides]